MIGGMDMKSCFNRVLVAGLLATSLAACGSSDGAGQAGAGEDNPTEVPKVDTGWTVGSDDDGAFVMKRQLNQLTLSYTLSQTSSGPKAKVLASVAPCSSGQGRQNAEETFTPIDDESAQIMMVRDMFDGVVGRISDRCRLPDNVRTDITAGFDGKYFSSDSQRAAITGS